MHAAIYFLPLLLLVVISWIAAEFKWSSDAIQFCVIFGFEPCSADIIPFGCYSASSISIIRFHPQRLQFRTLGVEF